MFLVVPWNWRVNFVFPVWKSRTGIWGGGAGGAFGWKGGSSFLWRWHFQLKTVFCHTRVRITQFVAFPTLLMQIKRNLMLGLWGRGRCKLIQFITLLQIFSLILGELCSFGCKFIKWQRSFDFLIFFVFLDDSSSLEEVILCNCYS